MGTPEVELQWWEGCPSTERARGELRQVLDDLDLDGVKIRMREIAGDDEARTMRFPGSPTILINGRDVVTPDPAEPIGLTCRVYRRRDGTVSPTPDPADLRDALQEALRGVSR
jgi:hypothetical protein